MKFRFWYMEYNVTNSKPSLPRLYWQTESFACEYDIPRRCPWLLHLRRSLSLRMRSRIRHHNPSICPARCRHIDAHSAYEALTLVGSGASFSIS